MFTLKDSRPVWAEINLNHLAHNIKEVRRLVGRDVVITAVVKADAYGHGALLSAKTLLDNGGDRLAVATLSEAMELRKAGIKAEILILGYTPSYQSNSIIENGITQTIYNLQGAKALSDEAKKLGKTAKIHLKIDTGMGRLGFLSQEVSIKEIIEIINLPNIYVEGIFSHFAKADEKDKDFSIQQYERFIRVINDLKKADIEIPIKHIANSASIIDMPGYNLDMVRAGIMLYGLYPSDEVNKGRVELKPVMTLKATISNIKTVPKGVGISYGHKFVTDKTYKIGTLPIGYADGFTRLLTSKGEVSIKGKRVPIIGSICMDQCMVDASDFEDVNVGDEVILFGDGSMNEPIADELASSLGTVNYEIVCMISRRVPRVYIKDNRIVCIKDYLSSL